MARLNEIITPEQIKRKRDAEEIFDLESLNKVISTVNNRLEYLPYGKDLIFSFTGEGFPFTVMEPVSKLLDESGWDVSIYGDASRDMGLKISWPEGLRGLKSRT